MYQPSNNSKDWESLRSGLMLLVPSRSSNATKSGTAEHLRYSSGSAFHKKQG